MDSSNEVPRGTALTQSQPTSKILPAPSPMAGTNQPVDWLFIYKFNAYSFPGCDDGKSPAKGTPGIFGGTVDDYPEGQSQQYVFATNENPALVKGKGCIGATLEDPLGATFAQVYNTPGYYYMLWNDQFYGNPIDTQLGPMGHSKGMLAWNQDGEGFVLQVSTPSWPASGCRDISRNSAKTIEDVKKGVKVKKGNRMVPVELDYNTLGCINDDDIEVAQHFFALKINHADLVVILNALANASVVTDPKEKAICNNGGPDDIQALVNQLGKESKSKDCTIATLSTGVQIISKPSALAVPPWQLISAKLGGLNLRVTSWWADPKIYSTKAGEVPLCWDAGLGTQGDVDIALSGEWNGISFALLGDNRENSNHAKIGISKDSSRPYSIFGDENQQGALCAGYDKTGEYGPQTPPKESKIQQCNSSQNGRGGTFYILNDPTLLDSLTKLFTGRTAGADAATTDLKGLTVSDGEKKSSSVRKRRKL